MRDTKEVLHALNSVHLNLLCVLLCRHDGLASDSVTVTGGWAGLHDYVLAVPANVAESPPVSSNSAQRHCMTSQLG